MKIMNRKCKEGPAWEQYTIYNIQYTIYNIQYTHEKCNTINIKVLADIYKG
jgi:hypothetical protein